MKTPPGPGIHVPTIITHRTDNVAVDVEGGRELAALIPNARYVELPGTDHIPFVGDNAGEIADAIEEFLTGSRASQAFTPAKSKLLGLCADDRASGSIDDCAGSRAARSARQQAAEYAADDSASACPTDRPLARRRRRRTRRRRCIFGAWRRRRDLFDRWICIFDIRNDLGRAVHRMIVEIPIATGHPPIAASSEPTFVWTPMPAGPRPAFANRNEDELLVVVEVRRGRTRSAGCLA